MVFTEPKNGCSSIKEKSFDEKEDTKDENTDPKKVEDNTSEPKKVEDNTSTTETLGGSYDSPIYAVERGGCSFVTKSRNAEEANGKVVIVYNDQQGGVDDIILMD